MKCWECGKEIPKDELILYEDTIVDWMGPGNPYHRECLNKVLKRKGKYVYKYCRIHEIA